VISITQAVFLLFFKSYLCAFLLLFAVQLTKPHIKHKALIWASAVVIPIAALILALNSPEYNFYRMRMFWFYPGEHLSTIYNVWLYINILYEYICLLLSIVFFVMHYRILSANTTVQRELIAELFHLANYDQLTDLFNRRYFENLCDKLDAGAYLPLAFISGDLNNLKYVNDTYGHAYGDRLIAAAAECFRRMAPEQGSICRVGGDEFVVVIPNYNKEQVVSFMDRLTAYMAEFREEPYGKIDISLGYAIRANMSDSIEQVLKEADMVMYKDKEKKKVSFRQSARPYNK